MTNSTQKRFIHINLDGRRLSIMVFSLFFSWMLAFPFQGQILYSLADKYKFKPDQMIFSAMAAHFWGLFFCGFLINSIKSAKQLIRVSIISCFILSLVFFFPPSSLWFVAIIFSGILAGASLSAWGYYFKHFTPKNKRIKTAADGLIYSNVLMVIINMITINLSAYIGLGFAMIMLLLAFLFALSLPEGSNEDNYCPSKLQKKGNITIGKTLGFLYLFVVIITINSGLMYGVITPTYKYLQGITSWYWAIPYIVALIIIRNLPQKTNRSYILFIAIAMIGFSFILFMGLRTSIMSYLLVDTLMMGAFGIFDLFWWSILGEMLDFYNNPAKLFGVGISANVLGVLIGSLFGKVIMFSNMQSTHSTMLALAVVCVTFVILPPLHKSLSSLLKDNQYLRNQPETTIIENEVNFTKFKNLSERESQVATLLLERKTYKMIAAELFISENTVKYYVKNIYSKFNVQSRSELIDTISKTER